MEKPKLEFAQLNIQKIYCEYAKSNNKILVSNGKSLVIKTRTSYIDIHLIKRL